MVDYVEFPDDVKTERIVLNAVRVTKSPDYRPLSPNEARVQIVPSPLNSGNYLVEEGKTEGGGLLNFDYWRSSKPKVVMSMDFAGIKIECLEYAVDGVRVDPQVSHVSN